MARIRRFDVTEGRCADLDPRMADQIFFSNRPPVVEQAKAECAACPIRELCLQIAMDAEARNGGIRDGVFGGLTPQERAAIAGGKLCRECPQEVPAGFTYCGEHALQARRESRRRWSQGVAA